MNAPLRVEDRQPSSDNGLEASIKGMTATGREIDLSEVDIGTVVKVKGGVGSFREVRQMLLERICGSNTSRSPNPIKPMTKH